MAVTINEETCVGCEACVEACPSGALSVDGVAKVADAACIDCGACVEECPTGAISA